ncbi:MAG: arginine--tRNA ligase [Bacillota bacterium]
MYALERLSNELRQHLQQAVEKLTGETSQDQVVLEVPPRPEFGDLSCPVAMKLARRLRRPPLAIAQDIAGLLRERLPGLVQEVTVAPPGYVNFTYSPALVYAILEEVRAAGPAYGKSAAGSGTKIVIEHTNVNPNKAAHIGHLRNACLGDTLARCHELLGYEVEVQNYIDDTGAAVADIVVGLTVLGHRIPEDRPIDHFCWDLYTAVNSEYERNPQLLQERARVLQEIEEGGNAVASLARSVATRIVHRHLETMWAFGVDYDLLTWEGHILSVGLWKHAFERLRQSPGLEKETQGPNAGCWMVRLAGHPEFAGLENPDKVLVRSNGTATYVAKDIAYQMWKFGLLGLDFGYEPFILQPSGRHLWTTRAAPGNDTGHTFGQAHRVINVIDIRQKYLQDILRVSLETLGYPRQAANSVHFGYEVVALSPSTAAELGVVEAAEGSRGMYAMAGRQGIGVKVDDLLDRMVKKTLEEVGSRRPDLTQKARHELARDIATTSIRYYMLRFHPGSTVVFDFDDALNLQGNSGPYLQYAVARAHSILRRAGSSRETAGAVPELLPAEKALVLAMGGFPGVLAQATASLQPSALAEYGYRLAGAFTAFYEAAPVLNAPEPARSFRLGLVEGFRHTMTALMTVLGLTVLESM